jgi:hypothetical protein
MVEPVLAQAPASPATRVSVTQPDFTIVALPTTLGVPRNRAAVRVTHRFSRSLGSEDLGSQIGFELRYGIGHGTQVGIDRTSDRTIEIFLQHEVKAQSDAFPFTISMLAVSEGTNEFRDSYSPAFGVVVSRSMGERAALYLEPIWVNNSNNLPAEVVRANDSVLLGLGARLRVRPTVYISVEGIPRVAGYAPQTTQVGIGIDKRFGGYSFQLNLSNGVGTTFANIARGAAGTDDWFLGFGISRKFF